MSAMLSDLPEIQSTVSELDTVLGMIATVRSPRTRPPVWLEIDGTKRLRLTAEFALKVLLGEAERLSTRLVELGVHDDRPTPDEDASDVPATALPKRVHAAGCAATRTRRKLQPSECDCGAGS